MNEVAQFGSWLIVIVALAAVMGLVAGIVGQQRVRNSLRRGRGQLSAVR